MDATPTSTTPAAAPSVKEVLENISQQVADIMGDAPDYNPEEDEQLAADLAIKLDIKKPENGSEVLKKTPDQIEAEVAAKVAEETDFKREREKWIKQSAAFHDQEMKMEDNRYRVVVGMNPKTDDDWKEICYKMFGGELLERVLTGDLHAARPDSRSGLEFDRKDSSKRWLNLFQWLSRSEQFFMRGMRMPQWVEPCYDELFTERKFAEDPVPVGVGYDYAVVLAPLAPKIASPAPEPKQKKTDLKASSDGAEVMDATVPAAATPSGQDIALAAELNPGQFYPSIMRVSEEKPQVLWNFFVCNISRVPERPRPANWRTAKENAEVLKSNNNKMIGELKKASPIAYVKASCPAMVKPAYVAIHGDWVSAVWTDRSAPQAPAAKADLLHLYKLPRMMLNPGDFVELLFPSGILDKYELHWPYFIMVCNNQEFFGIPWVAELGNVKSYKKIKNMTTVKEFMFVINLQDKILTRAFEIPSTGVVDHLALYPPKNSVLCASVDPRDVKILWTCDDPGGPTHRALFEDYMLRDKSSDIEMNYMWKRAEQEVEQRRTKNIVHVSPPDLPARAIRRFHGGHTVMISAYNHSTLVRDSPPLYPTNEIYFGRDQVILDRAVYLNTVVTLYADYTIAFSCARASDPTRAVSTISRFSVKDLIDWGDNPGRIIPKSRVLYYKAIWMAVDRIVVQFQDGMLLFLSAMSEREYVSMKELVAKARLNKETKNQLQQLVEKKVTDAANEALVKKQAEDAAKQTQNMEH